MIKINLLGDTTVREAGGKLLLVAYVSSVALLLLLCIFLQHSVSTETATLASEQTRLESDLSKLKAVTQEVRDLEKKRKELNEKLTIIATLKRNKIGPVRVMDDLNLSLPERAWLTEIQERAEVLRISGFALDNQTISNFMKSLESSDYFQTVDLQEVKQAEKLGVNIKSFTINAAVNYAGKIKLEQPAEDAAKVKAAADGATAPKSKGDGA